MSRMLLLSLLDLGALGGVIAFAEQAHEQLARIILHRQRRGRRAEGDGIAEAAAIGAVAGRTAALFFRGDLKRGKRRILADMLRGDLIDRHAAMGRRAALRRHATEPGAWRDGVNRRADRRLIAEAADDRELLLERGEGLEDFTEFVIGALGLGRPAAHDLAMRQIKETHIRLGGTRRRLGERRSGRDHRVQQRQRDRISRPPQKCPPWEMLLRNIHQSLLRNRPASKST